METTKAATITVETTVQAPVEKVWETWTKPEHIKGWCFASDEWHAPYAENEMRTGYQFKTRMEAKDGSMGFDFGGEYTRIEEHRLIEYTMSDGRKVSIRFEDLGSQTRVIESFDPENTHPHDFQQAGWQAILDNFRKYTEALA